MEHEQQILFALATIMLGLENVIASRPVDDEISAKSQQMAWSALHAVRLETEKLLTR